MENTFGSRLSKYRKKKGLSQEELAFKLDVSRQAVSKRERDEASPDTNNLISLAKIYGVSLDDLLYKDPDEIENKKDEEVERENKDNLKSHRNKEYVSVGPNGIHIVDDEDEVHIDRTGIKIHSSDEDDDIEVGTSVFGSIKSQFPKTMLIKSIINSTGYLLFAVIYLILGFTLPNGDGWRIYWTLIFIPDIFNSLLNCFMYKKVTSFNITFLVLFAYLFTGMYLNLWHPTRIIFFAIPLFYLIGENIDKALRACRKKKEYDNIVVENIEE